MTGTCSSATADWATQLFDTLAATRSADAALHQVDQFRRQVAGDSIFSIQQNVTTAADPANEIRLRRWYSSEAERFPVQGRKRKTAGPWLDCLFLRGRVFVGEGVEVLARTFDDFDQMRAFGVHSVVNVPLLQGNLCYATFNVFATRERWPAEQVLRLQLLALAAARWVPRAPGLAYAFDGTPDIVSLET